MRLIWICFSAAVIAASSSSAAEPQRPWERLAEGNRHFVAGELSFDDLAAQRAALRDQQHPEVTVLSCSDSRVPPELVFDQSLGSLFVIRVAGNVTDSLGLASIEYAIAQGYTTLIVVLGHEECGAVKAALAPDDPGTPSLQLLLERIRASFAVGTFAHDDAASVRKAVEANARASAAWLPAHSRIIRDAVREGKVEIVPAYYSLATGEVTRLSE